MTELERRGQATSRPERLLVWDPAEGWEPLCAFLGAEVPAEELPRLNDTQAFCEGITGGALGVVNEWWEERERPTEGLHGAALSSSSGGRLPGARSAAASGPRNGVSAR